MNAKQQQAALQAALHASQQLAAALGQVTGGTPTVPALYMDYLPPELRGAPKDYFVYGMQFLPVAAAGGVANDSFTVESNSDFLITYLAAEVADPAAPGTAVPTDGLTITITDAGSGRQFQNRALAFNTIVGTGLLPAYMPWPKFVDRSSQVTAEIANNKLAQDVDIRLSFVGFKIFSKSQAGLR